MTGRRSRLPDAPAPIGLLAHTAPRWQKIAQAVLILLIIGATIAVLGLVVQGALRLGQMTTEVSVAQQRTTHLHTLQVSALHLHQALIELDSGDGDADAVAVRRGLFGRMVTVVLHLYPESSAQAAELRAIQAGLDRFPWDRLAARDRDIPTGTARTLVSQLEVRIKALYDQQEVFFYDATRESLGAKADGERGLAALVSLVVVMAVCLVILLRRRARTRLSRAYDALVTEVSERRTLQDQLSHQAFHDALTGLPNRALFLRRLADSMGPADGRSPASTVVLVDLDGFKNVNDTLGHAAGDRLLQQIADRLRTCVRAGDTVARLGGDEFAVLMPACTRDDALAVGRRLVDAVTAPVVVHGQEISISASAGIADLEGQSSAADLLADADIAMYAAKKAGKARYEVFRPGMRDETLRRVRIEQQLARAVANREIEVFYQPIVDLGTGRISAVEALARWRHPEDGLIAPDRFIPVAEDSGLIREIGRDVLRQACAAVQLWRRTVPGRSDLSVTVNVSVRQLLSGGFCDHLVEALRDTGLPAANLTLEITESMLLEESDTVTAELARIKSTGVRLAMDDFGAGYSSIAVLLRLQVDVLKVDRAFLEVDSRGNGALMRAIAELGHALGLTVVAEGVETPEQLEHVRAANCDAAQGYLFARPLPAGAARQHLEQVEVSC